jgi:stress response protein YsnF
MRPERPAVSVPVRAERLRIARRVRAGDTVRVTVRPRRRVVVVDEPTAAERVSVERVAVDRFVDQPVPPRRDGDTLVISVVEEVVVVAKRLKVVEEVRITRKREITRRPVRVTLNEEEAIVERRRASPATGRNEGRTIKP